MNGWSSTIVAIVLVVGAGVGGLRFYVNSLTKDAIEPLEARVSTNTIERVILQRDYARILANQESMQAELKSFNDRLPPPGFWTQNRTAGE